MEKLPFDYMNAAGWVKTVEHVKRIVKVEVISHVILGGFTVLEREGNIGGTAFIMMSDGTAGNVLGIPNGGKPYLMQHGREMANIIHDHGKLAVLNGNWFEPKETGVLAEVAFEIGCDIYENNSGCPNKFDGGEQQCIASYNPELLERADEHIARAVGDKPVWEKLSPFVNPLDRDREAKRIIARKRTRVTTCNTLPNVRLRDPRTGVPLITAKNTRGYSGVSGTAMKYVGLCNAEHFVELLAPHGIGVNGTSGIRSGQDLEDYRRVGCAGMQVGAAVYAADSPRPLDDIAISWLHDYVSKEAAE